MSLQGCLASRKDSSGEGQPLPLQDILKICKSTLQAAQANNLFIVLPDGDDYTGGIYKYNSKEFTLVTDKEKTTHSMELYPELFWKDTIDLEDLIRVGLCWQYLSLKVGSLGLGISQRARPPKKLNKLINKVTNQNHVWLYSVAVRGRDRGELVEDSSKPYQSELEEGTFLLDTPDCYKNRGIYNGSYEGVPLDSVIYDKIEKRIPNNISMHDLSQLLWACQGETDHTTHGNRDGIEKFGYGRVHASGCAGYSVYPMVFVENFADLPKGGYIYNPVGFSALNRWVRVNTEVNYDHFIQEFTTDNSKTEIEEEFGIDLSNCLILLCIDRKAPCSGFMHSKIGKAFMNPRYWAEIEAGMALAGLQLQANAVGLQWQKKIIINPDKPSYRKIFNLDLAEDSINMMAGRLVNQVKNERLSLKSHLVPVLLFYLK